jgi:hypothetical protein
LAPAGGQGDEIAVVAKADAAMEDGPGAIKPGALQSRERQRRNDVGEQQQPDLVARRDARRLVRGGVTP